jgi:hypothetical protein
MDVSVPNEHDSPPHRDMKHVVARAGFAEGTSGDAGGAGAGDTRNDGRGGRWITGPWTAAVVLALFWAAMVASLRDKSITYDEIAHATAGYAFWRLDDFRLNPENGNLPQRVAALPLIWGDFPFPDAGSRAWERADVWTVGHRWFHESGNDARVMLQRGRAVCGLFAVALGALVWGWARRLFGGGGGLIALLLYVLNPTVLANGALMTSDAAAALTFLAATGAWWMLLQRVTPLRLTGSTLATAALFLSKMSAPLIAPIVLVLIGVRLIVGGALPLEFPGRVFTVNARSRVALACAALMVVHLLVVWAALWPAFGFRFPPSVSGDDERLRFAHPWEYVLRQSAPAVLLDRLALDERQREGVNAAFAAHRAMPLRWSHDAAAALDDVASSVLTAEQVRSLAQVRAAPPAGSIPRLLDTLRRARLLPEAYLYGQAHAWRFAQERGAFARGQFSLHGWWWFFPYTALVKTPLPLFALAALAIAALLARRFVPAGAPDETAGVRWPTAPLWVLLALYWAAAMAGSLNIGHRHILATYPPLFILCGASVHWVRTWRAGGGFLVRVAGVFLIALTVLHATETALHFPNYLAYFNAAAGGPTRGWRHLVDSSLDWGQELPAIRRFLDREKPEGPVYLAYFGNGSPAAHGISATPLCPLAARNPPDSPPLRLVQVPPGVLNIAALAADLVEQRPDYAFAGTTAVGEAKALMLLKTPAALRFAPGIYLISATMLQPVAFPLDGPWGPWNTRHEATWRELRAEVEPLLGDNPAARAAAFSRRPPLEWWALLDRFDQFRFARLTAWLRQREPDGQINFSVLVYRLSADDLARALDGPPVELGPDVAAAWGAQQP